MIGAKYKTMRLLAIREKRSAYLTKKVLNNDEVKLTIALNIPGIKKRSSRLDWFYQEVVKTLEKKWLIERNIQIVSKEFHEEGYLWTLYVLKNIDPHSLKRQLMQWEIVNACFALVDFDVYTNEKKISRTDIIKNSYRQCFICQDSAKQCARERRHSKKDVHRFINHTLKSFCIN